MNKIHDDSVLHSLNLTSKYTLCLNQVLTTIVRRAGWGATGTLRNNGKNDVHSIPSMSAHRFSRSTWKYENKFTQQWNLLIENDLWTHKTNNMIIYINGKSLDIEIPIVEVQDFHVSSVFDCDFKPNFLLNFGSGTACVYGVTNIHQKGKWPTQFAERFVFGINSCKFDWSEFYLHKWQTGCAKSVQGNSYEK